jgi:hypothetical protein
MSETNSKSTVNQQQINNILSIIINSLFLFLLFCLSAIRFQILLVWFLYSILIIITSIIYQVDTQCKLIGFTTKDNFSIIKIIFNQLISPVIVISLFFVNYFDTYKSVGLSPINTPLERQVDLQNTDNLLLQIFLIFIVMYFIIQSYILLKNK